MRSIVNSNGDIIKQTELEALIEAESAFKRLVGGMAVRIASGARVEKGERDIYVDSFSHAQELDLYRIDRDLSECGEYKYFEIVSSAHSQALVSVDEEIRAERARFYERLQAAVSVPRVAGKLRIVSRHRVRAKGMSPEEAFSKGRRAISAAAPSA